jgi:hypothetical protein
VGFDRVGDRVQFLDREAERRQPLARQFGRTARGGGAGRIVLRQVDQVVQVAGGQHHQHVGLRIIGEQGLRGAPDAVEVAGIVGAIEVAGGAFECEGGEARTPFLEFRRVLLHRYRK